MTSNGLTNMAAITGIVVLTFGCGITLMPSVYKTLGQIPAFSLMCCIGLMTFHSIYSLSYTATVTKETEDEKQSYSGIAAKISKKFAHTVSISLACASIITIFSFTQMILTIFIKTLQYNNNIAVLLEDNFFFYAMRILFLSLICVAYFFTLQFENLSSFSYLSSFSLWIAVSFSLFVCFLGLYKPSDVLYEAKSENVDLSNPLGCVIFALHCQFSYMDIFNEMQNKSLKNVTFVTAVASIFATILYSMVGFLGFRAFGGAIDGSPIILTFADSSSPVMISLTERYGEIIGFYIPRTMLTLFLPIFFGGILFNTFSILPILQNAIKFRGKPLSRKNVVTLSCLFIFLFGIKDIRDALGSVFAICGFLLTTPLSFLFPALFVLYTPAKKSKLLTASSYLIAAISFVIMIGLTALKIKNG